MAALSAIAPNIAIGLAIMALAMCAGAALLLLTQDEGA